MEGRGLNQIRLKVRFYQHSSCCRTAVVRVHGYKHEEELSLQDLEPSLGKQEIQHQIQQAELYKVLDDNRRILDIPRVL